MNLNDRIHNREKCRVGWCERERVTDTLFCHEHLNDSWAGRLIRLSDGTFAGKAPRRPAWVERMADNSKDFTGARAA